MIIRPTAKAWRTKPSAQYKAAATQPIFREHFTQRQTDFSEIIARLKNARIAMVYFGGYHDQIAGFVRQAREQASG